MNFTYVKNINILLIGLSLVVRPAFAKMDLDKWFGEHMELFEATRVSYCGSAKGSSDWVNVLQHELSKKGASQVSSGPVTTIFGLAGTEVRFNRGGSGFRITINIAGMVDLYRDDQLLFDYVLLQGVDSNQCLLTNNRSVYSEDQLLQKESLREDFVDIKLFNPEPMEREKIEAGRFTVKVAVIDTGVDYNHPQLREHILLEEIGVDFADDDNRPYDTESHGTAVAGFVLGDHSFVQVLPIRLPTRLMDCDENGCFLEAEWHKELEKAFQFASEHNVDIVASSFNYHAPLRDPASADYLGELVAKYPDILFVFPAGNGFLLDDQTSPQVERGFPLGLASKRENVIVVGGVRKDGSTTGYHVGRHSIHLGAPAENLDALIPFGNLNRRRSGIAHGEISFDDQESGVVSGSSFSAPMVANVAAQMIHEFESITNSELRPAQIKSIFRGTVKRSKRYRKAYKFGGTLDKDAALRAAAKLAAE